MTKKYKLGVYIFTRDLRLHDNTTLIYGLKECNLILPIFIFNPEQLSDSNKYKSDNCIQFMCDCLADLNKSLNKYNSRLFLFYGKPSNIIKELINSNENIECVYINKDYTPFATNRAESIKKVCSNLNVNFTSLEDYLLTGCEMVLNGSGNTYVKFTPFMNSAKKLKVKSDIKNNHTNYVQKKIKFNNEYTKSITNFFTYNKNIWSKGGRANALKILKKINDYKKYNESRDVPIESTTNLSPYLKFNVVSIREVYRYFKSHLPTNSKLIDQLYWRDFYMIIMYNHNVINHNMNNYKIKWSKSTKLLNLWKEGNTGFPIVDAGMRQLNSTGYMHNRVRMIVGSFLVKILHIDWQEGEKYFATKLIDYDPSNNNGGWQWCAGTGTDSQPYFRYLNPWSQALKFDKKCLYIKKYVKELKNVSIEDIHNWNIKYDKYDKIYPKPIFDDVTERVKFAIKMYYK